jgi:MFS family permease
VLPTSPATTPPDPTRPPDPTTPPDPRTRRKRYGLWLFGTGATVTGNGVFSVAMGWQATSYGAREAGVVLGISSLVGTVFLLFGGALSDRLRPRQVMLVSTAAMFLVALLAAVVGWIDALSPAWLVAFAVALGLETAFFTPSSASMTRQLVTKEGFARALSLRQVVGQVASISGRLVGGVLVTIGGVALASVVNASTYLVVFVVLLLLQVQIPVRQERPVGTVRSIGAGLTFVAGDRVLRSVVALTGAVAGFLLPLSTLLVPLIARDRGLGSVGAGALLATISIVTMLVALVVSVRGASRRLGAWALAGVATAAVGFSVLALPSPVGAFVGCAVAGLGQGLYIAHGAPLVRSVPDELMGRVQSTQALVQTAVLGLSTIFLGAVVAKTGVTVGSGLCAIVLGAAAAIGCCSRPLRQASLEALRPES